eukprot:m.936257 g.936257  ORF g.936257 m.936257 type:complete len:406 (-) comp23809_c1_seq3:1765-2982(-)
MASITDKRRSRNQTNSDSGPRQDHRDEIYGRRYSDKIPSRSFDHGGSKNISTNYFENVPLGTPVAPLHSNMTTDTPSQSADLDVSQVDSLAAKKRSKNATSRHPRKNKSAFTYSVDDDEELSTAYNSEAQVSDTESVFAPLTSQTNLSSSTMETVGTKHSSASSTIRSRVRKQGSFSRSYKKDRKGSSGSGMVAPPPKPPEVVNLHDLGSKHTSMSMFERTKSDLLQRLMSQKDRTDRQSSLGGSSTDFSNNNALWKTDDVWLAEVEDIDRNIKELQSSFAIGKMQAFGSSAQKVYRDLDKLRTEQERIFRTHIDVEKLQRTQFGNPIPSVEIMEADFDPYFTESDPERIQTLFSEVGDLCEQIKDFSTASTDRNTEVISPIYEQTERPPRSQRNLTTLSSDALP